ncbi:MAG: hypothetical protein ACREVV_00270 [Steroidobacteraceae bacterium]
MGCRIGFAFVLGPALALSAGTACAANADSSAPPHYAVDPFWPEQLPNNWIMGQVAGLAVDSHDHIWVLQRPRSSTADELGAAQSPPRSTCCVQTPAVLEFAADGHVLNAWGGPGYVPDWPKSEHAIWVDGQDHVWIGGAGSGDRQVLKFSSDGHLLLEIGHPSNAPADNRDTSVLGQPAGIQVDDAAHEVYIADGYLNNRVVVFDSDSGKFKRGWGAYGASLSAVSRSSAQAKLADATSPAAVGYVPGAPPDRQFRTPVHCARLSADGLVYVCDRRNDRIQVFTKQGHFVQEFFVHPATLGNGSVWTVEFSSDRAQRYLLVADGEDNVVWVLNRADGGVVSSFGHNGRNAGQFHWVHQTTVDSKGNFYTGEVDTGKRVQKFLLQNDAR